MTLYNPHLLARQELVEAFAARQPLLDELIDDLRRGGRQHHLLVGTRGSGKTTLLLRLAAAIEDDAPLAKKCIPLRFPEEQYNVSRPSDFWMNAIDALVDALERHGDGAAAKRLEIALAELEDLDEDDRAKRSLGVLEGWAKQARRLVVLLVDNVDLVFERLADSLWALREALSAENRLVLIGASSKFIEEAIEYGSPLYDFFSVHELGPLSEEEARQLVLKLAERAQTTRVADILERDPGRFKALYVLTGGTPRTLALLHTVIAFEHSDRIERDLDGLLDQLTPYYKARFDDLPSQSQVIVDKVALHWHPITAAECQAATHLEINVVSAQLNRLVKSGLLTKVSLPGETKLGFQLSERFFNIWYLMRASRRQRRRLSWFVEFLQIFYGEQDLRRRAEELIRAAAPDSLNSPAKFLAFASAVPDEALRRRLEFRAIGLLMDTGIAAIHDAMDLEGEDLHLAPVVDRVRALREIRSRIAKAKVKWPSGQTASSVADMIARHPAYPLAMKQQVSSLVAKGDMQRLNVLRDTLGELSNELGDRLLDAISTGEVPSLVDVMAADEMRQVIELGESRWRTVSWLVLSTQVIGAPFSDDLLRQILLMGQGTVDGIVTAAGRLVVGASRGEKARHWTRARHLVLTAIRHAVTPLPLQPFLFFLRGCIDNNRTSEVLDLFVEADLAERWAPLYEALRAFAEGSKARLDGLAPEMRVAALEVHDWLRGGAVSQANAEPGGEVSSSRPGKRKPSGQRGPGPPTRGKRRQGARGRRREVSGPRGSAQ